jgi:[ribosomal protein S5]-alanine N-acetyltransferase
LKRSDSSFVHSRQRMLRRHLDGLATRSSCVLLSRVLMNLLNKHGHGLTYFENHQQTHGFSKWVILNATSGAAIGDAGLLVLPECGWIDLGFRLSKPHWGQGLATEAASAWVRTAFDKYHIHRLGAFVHPENVASIRVLEKLGFQAERRDTVMGMQSIVFSLDANSFRASD